MRPTTMQPTRARVQLKPEPKTATLAAQWLEHANRTLPLNASAAEIRRQEREWYLRRLEELEAAPKTAENAALLVEAAGWARVSIGRAA